VAIPPIQVVMAKVRSTCGHPTDIISTMEKHGYVYIMTNEYNTVLYTGVTSDLKKRIYQHREGFGQDFCKRYNLKKLVYYEISLSIESSIAREKQIKKGSRKKKEELVTGMNAEWQDLYPEL
jgi:putative endonuclease